MTLENPSARAQTGGALTPTEQQVADLWREILQSDAQLGPHDNFFASGGDSLAMTMVLFRANEVFGVELAPTALMEAPELRSFAALVDLALLAADQTMERSTL
jgi:acyl carrier protein